MNKKSSEYNGVSFDANSPHPAKRWKARIILKSVVIHVSHHVTEREAAIAADKVYIQYGLLKKVNILKNKTA